MYVLQNKSTGEIIDPRTCAFPIDPSEVGKGYTSWDEALADDLESDLIDGFAVVEFIEKTPQEIIREIESKLSVDAASFFNGYCGQVNEFIILAQEKGVDFAVSEIELLAVEEITDES